MQKECPILSSDAVTLELPANGNTKMHAFKAKGYFLKRKTKIQVCTMVKKALPGNAEIHNMKAESSH